MLNKVVPELLIVSQGRIFIEPTLPELTPPERAAAYRQLATTLAALHSVKPQAVNLQRYGRPSGYCARQVRLALHTCLHLLAFLHAHTQKDPCTYYRSACLSQVAATQQDTVHVCGDAKHCHPCTIPYPHHVICCAVSACIALLANLRQLTSAKLS